MIHTPEFHCKGCWLFEERRKISEAISDVLEEIHKVPNESKWDYRTCLVGCWKKDLKEAQIARNYYHRKHPKAKWRAFREEQYALKV